jgi:hypothetical protein
VAVFIVFTCLTHGLSSFTDTGLFTLDTIVPSLDLISPNGGEEWYIGDNNDITWTASDTNLNPNSVYLWYSFNGGTDYIDLAGAIANNLHYAWQMPTYQSYNVRVRIRISDTFGNFALDVSSLPFSITYVPPAAPEGVNVNVANNLDAVITWQPVTHTILPYNTPITPDGYIVLYNETPYEDEQFYYYLGETAGAITFTHYNVARRRTQMYYRVIAFKDYGGRMTDLLRFLNQPAADRMSLGEMLKIVRMDEGIALQSPSDRTKANDSGAGSTPNAIKESIPAGGVK